MQKIKYPSEYFDAADTLYCGQLFRFTPKGNGFNVYSRDKSCYLFTDGAETVIECEDADADYFYNYFDLKRDYSAIVKRACDFGGALAVAAGKAKGVRILNQDAEEALFSFVVSQNNNIPRIKGIIERLCAALGEEKSFGGETYRAFPAAKAMAARETDFFYGVGLGYRAPFVKRLAEDVASGNVDVNALKKLPSEDLKTALKGIYGVGQKVADCAALFGFGRTDSFPADVWIEKVYREDFGGTLTDRAKISAWFENLFGDDSGYFQQYLFYYKRTLEKQSAAK